MSSLKLTRDDRKAAAIRAAKQLSKSRLAIIHLPGYKDNYPYVKEKMLGSLIKRICDNGVESAEVVLTCHSIVVLRRTA